MHIEYVLLPKESTSVKLSSDSIHSIICDCFDRVSKKTFIVTPVKSEYTINYSISYSDYQNIESVEKVYSVIFEFEHSRKDRTAEILDFVHRRFATSLQLSEHHLILAFDEVSEYYCNKCFPHFQRFERLIRQLIFKIMTKAFGALWIDKTISDEIRNSLKKMISIYYPEAKKDKRIRDEKIIEEALYQMDISELEKFLFDESRNADTNHLIDYELSKEKIADMSKDEIIAIIDEGRLKSLWERFFSQSIPIEKPKEKISDLREARNKIAHSKPFFYYDYCEAKRMLEEFTPLIEKAIRDIGMVKYEAITLFDVLSGFSDALVNAISFIRNIGKTIVPALEKLADIGLSASKMLQQSGIVETKRIMMDIKPLPLDLSLSSRISSQIDISKYSHDLKLDIFDAQQRLSKSMQLNLPVLSEIQRRQNLLQLTARETAGTEHDSTVVKDSQDNFDISTKEDSSND